MNNQFIRPLAHVSKQPVSVERVHPDRILIEGVLFDGDYFREIGYPKTDVLYMVRKDLKQRNFLNNLEIASPQRTTARLAMT
jgi:hypothetical protein